MAGNRHVTGLLSNKKKKVKMKKNDVCQKRKKKMRAKSSYLDSELDIGAVKRFAILLNLVLTSIYCNDNHRATAYKSKDRGMFQLILLCCYAVGNCHNTGLRYNKKKKVKMKTDVESCYMKSLEDQFYLESGTTKRSDLCLPKMLVKFVLRMLLFCCSDKFSRTLQYPRHSPNEISKSSRCSCGIKVLLKPVFKDKIKKMAVSTTPYKSMKSSDIMHTSCNADRYTSRETSLCCIRHLKRLLVSGDLVLILALRNGRVLMFIQFSLEQTGSFSCSVLRCVDKNRRWSGLAFVPIPFAVLVDSGIRAECVSVHGRNGSVLESRYSRFSCDIISSLLFRVNAVCSSELDNELFEHIVSPFLQNGIPKQLIYYLLGCCVPLLSCVYSRSLGRTQVCAPDLEQRGQGQGMENLSKIVNRSRFRSRIRFYQGLLVWICKYMIQVICLPFLSRVGNGRMTANYDRSEEVKYVSNCCRKYCTLLKREYYVLRYVSSHRKYESPASCLLSGYDKHVRKKSNLKSLQSYLCWWLSKNYLSSLFKNDCRIVGYSNKLSKKRRYSLGTLASYKCAKVIVDSLSLFFNGGRFPYNFEDQSGLTEAAADFQGILRISHVSNESLCVLFISCGFYKFQVTMSRRSGFNEDIYYKSDKYEVVGFEFFVDRLININDNYLLSVNDHLSSINEYVSSVNDRLTSDNEYLFSVNEYLQNTNDKLCYSSLLRDYDNYVRPREEHRLETNVKCLFQFGSHDISTSQEGNFESLISVCPVCRSVHTETYTTFHLPNDYFVYSVSTEQLRQSLIPYRNETDEISGISFLSNYKMASNIVADAQDERITSETFENILKYNNYYSKVIPQGIHSPCNMLESCRSIPNRQSKLSVDRSIHNRQSKLSVDRSILNRQSKLSVDRSILNRQSKLSVDRSILNRQSKLSVDRSILNRQSKLSVDRSILNRQSKRSVDRSILNRQSKRSVDRSIHNRQSKRSVDRSILNRQSKLSVDRSIPNRQSKLSVDRSIPNRQSKLSVDRSILNRQSKLSVDRSILNRQSKLSVDHSIHNRQSKRSVDRFESIAHASSVKRVQNTVLDNFSKNNDYSQINAYR